VSRSTAGVPPYRVVYSDWCRETTRQLLARAAAKGRLVQFAQAVRDIERRLQWIPLDFGEPLRDFVKLGVQERLGSVAPLVVRFGVDEANRLVFVNLPFGLLPRSGLRAAERCPGVCFAGNADG
jgi:hypothetical protein